MSQSPQINRRIVLAARPTGLPQPGDFRLEETAVPEPPDGFMLLRTVFLSLDPYMRGRMSDAPSYAPPVALDAVMVGGTVCRVVASRLAGFAAGDLVVAMAGWQDYALSDGSGVRKLPPAMARPSLALGVLGMPGFTAYMGLLEIGVPLPGETLVVAAATGAVGAVVGQIGRLKGCHVVGIAGGAEKCAWATGTLGFDACLDHRAPDLPARLAQACPRGIDVYFENVGGAVFQAVLPLLNPRARIPLCGLVSGYNGTAPEGPDRSAALMRSFLTKRITLRGFIIHDDFGDRLEEFLAAMTPWVATGKIIPREDVLEGLENAPAGLVGVLMGRNFGKQVVRVGPD